MPPKPERFKLNVLRELHKFSTGLLETHLRDSLTRTYASSEIPFDQCILEMNQDGLIEFDTAGTITLGELGKAQIELHLKERDSRRQNKRDEKEKRQAKVRAGLQARQTHNELQQLIADLGYSLGYRWRLEHELVRGGSVRLDVVWYRDPEKQFSHAFEVQNRGDWKNAIGNLEAVRRYHGNCRVFLVVVDEKEIKKIGGLLGERRSESVTILRASDIEKWHRDLLPLSSQMQKAGLIG